MPFSFRRLKLDGTILVECLAHADDRGFFVEAYKKSDFFRNGVKEDFVQDNHSFSKRGVLRGLHFQRAPKEQGKLIRVVCGSIWDVAVDLRKDSVSFGKWIGVELSAMNHLMLYIPSGFGHGFYTLSDETHVIYKCTEEYDRDLDAGVRWNDPDICIEWPSKFPILSAKDGSLPFLKELA